MAAVTTTELDPQIQVRHPAQAGVRKVDGRSVRRDRNRDAVIDAFLDLVREGRLRPSVAEIAARSAVSHRSVFRYFTETDALIRAAIVRQVERVAHLIDTSVDLTLPTVARIDTMVRRRMAVYGEVAHVERLVRALAHEQPLLRQELANNRALSRLQIGRMFAPELAAMDAATAANTLAVIDVMCSFDSFDLLRNDQGLTEAEATEAIGQALRRLFA